MTYCLRIVYTAEPACIRCELAAMCSKIFNKVSGWFEQVFDSLGQFIGRHPVKLILLCIILSVGLGCGLLTLSTEKDIEVLYTPIGSRASQDREHYQRTFPDTTGSNYIRYALTSDDVYSQIIMEAKEDNIFTSKTIVEIQRLVSQIESHDVEYLNRTYRYSDLCAVRNAMCYVSGKPLTSNETLNAMINGNMTYPIWQGIRLADQIGKVKVTNGRLISAEYLRITFHLRQDSVDTLDKSNAWIEEFLKFVETLNTTETRIFYSSSQSLNIELDKNTSGDIVFFSLTFTLMIFYATVIAGGDIVSSRTWASWAGVLAAGFGVISALGLVSLAGVKFVNIVGVMPFLIIGIGVDDMFLLMSTWKDTYGHADQQNIPRRMGATFRSAGIGITITSITDCLAFCIGATSVFNSVRSFCIYTGVAVIFTYLYQCFFFGSCLALHGRRVYSGRHCLTCRKTSTRKSLRGKQRSCCVIFCCGGSPPSKREDDECILEGIPGKYIPRMLLNGYGYFIVVFLYLGYLGVSIWGITRFQEGLELKNLVSSTSYYREYEDVVGLNFQNSFPVPFIFGSSVNNTDPKCIDKMNSLFESAQSDPDISNGSLISWYHSYKSSPNYSNQTDRFIGGLKQFLTFSETFQNDVVFDATNSTIIASRFYLFSSDIKDSNRQADLMVRMRELSESSQLSVYVYYPAFIYFEQYIAILPSTLQTVGITLAAVTLVTFLFLPHLLLVLLVVLNIVSILVGIFGFLAFWGLSLSSVTMIHLIMSVGFSVDFSVHVCSAYMLSDKVTRKEKVKSAITHAAGPILNGGMSSFLGIIVLVFSKSYIFNSFFKIMFTVLTLGILHAVFLLPVILCAVGPLASRHKTPDQQDDGTVKQHSNSTGNNEPIQRRHGNSPPLKRSLGHTQLYQEGHVAMSPYQQYQAYNPPSKYDHEDTRTFKHDLGNVSPYMEGHGAIPPHHQCQGTFSTIQRQDGDIPPFDQDLENVLSYTEQYQRTCPPIQRQYGDIPPFKQGYRNVLSYTEQYQRTCPPIQRQYGDIPPFHQGLENVLSYTEQYQRTCPPIQRQYGDIPPFHQGLENVLSFTEQYQRTCPPIQRQYGDIPPFKQGYGNVPAYKEEHGAYQRYIPPFKRYHGDTPPYHPYGGDSHKVFVTRETIYPPSPEPDYLLY